MEQLIAGLIEAFDHVVAVWSHDGAFVLNIAEEGLRVPLRGAGLTGVALTIGVALVPFLTLIGAYYIFRGILRSIIIVLLAIFVLHALWPLTSEIPMLMHGTNTSAQT